MVRRFVEGEIYDQLLRRRELSQCGELAGGIIGSIAALVGEDDKAADEQERRRDKRRDAQVQGFARFGLLGSGSVGAHGALSGSRRSQR
jgi:hypothetical protein